VAAESTNLCDRKGNEADVGATPHFLRALLELCLLSTAQSGFGRREARSTEKTGNKGLNSEFRASDAVIVHDNHIHGEGVIDVGELN
jgi:hypothetical protein